MSGNLFAVSDLHVSHPANRRIVESLRPEADADWLIVAGDVSEIFDEVIRTLRMLSDRFAKVIWTPGNHELWTHPEDRVQLRGDARYRALVAACRELGVLTPEDDFAVWQGADEPLLIAPLFLLYDYSFRAPGTRTKAESLQYAYKTGVVCSDEMLLHPDPFPSREAWCRARLAETERRLMATDPGLRTVLVSHWPLVRQPLEVLRFPEFAQWCGTDRTADWPVRFRADVAVYGHLHIPRTTHYDGVRFEEVSLGYPRERRAWRGKQPEPLRTVLRAATAVS